MKDWDIMTDMVTGYKHLVHRHSDDYSYVKSISTFHWCTAQRDWEPTSWCCNYCYKDAPVAMQDVADLAGCKSANTWYSDDYLAKQKKRQ